MTRRDFAAAAAAALCSGASSAAEEPVLRNMGGAPAGFPVRSRAARDQGHPFDFVEYCHSLGFGVVETRLNTADEAAVKDLRRKLDAWQMRVILDVPLPRDEAAVPAFDAALQGARAAGAYALHTAMTQRRYEEFDSLDAFKRSFERNQKTIALAEPVLRKNRIRLGMENHKGWRSAEQAAWLKRLSSEWVGVHFDFGNNLALCEDPLETLSNLLPFIVSCHLKDMAVQPYDEGFLLSEVPLGEGCLDIPGMVAAIQKKDPQIPFDLEMITRDPLKIPVFTDRYWATFDDSYSPLSGRDLAHVLELVRRNPPRQPLPRTTGMTAAAQLALEDENVRRSIAYARKNLHL